eukprot:1556339-Rhodomonas_salina.1
MVLIDAGWTLMEEVAHEKWACTCERLAEVLREARVVASKTASVSKRENLHSPLLFCSLEAPTVTSQLKEEPFLASNCSQAATLPSSPHLVNCDKDQVYISFDDDELKEKLAKEQFSSEGLPALSLLPHQHSPSSDELHRIWEFNAFCTTKACAVAST